MPDGRGPASAHADRSDFQGRREAVIDDEHDLPGEAASPTVSATDVALTFGGFVLLYTVLGVIDVGLMYQAARRGLGTGAEEPPSGPPREGAEELVY